MTLIVIAVSAVFFAVYLSCFRYFGVDARIEMVFLHTLTSVFVLLFAVFLAFLLVGDYPGSAVTATIACLSGVGTVLVKYIVAEMIKKHG